MHGKTGPEIRILVIRHETDRPGQDRGDLWHQEDGKRIVKLYKRHVPEDDIQREFQISKLVHALGIQTPEPLGIIRMNDRTGILFERATGESLLRLIGKHPEDIKRYASKLAALHHSLHIHQIDGQLARQKNVLQHNIQSAAALTDQEKDITLEHLAALPDGDRLCHGDFHPDNVLVGEKDWILDWLNGMCSHPAGDVARTVILIRTGAIPPETPRHIQSIMNRLRTNFKEQYVQYYLQFSGLKFEEIGNWMLPVAAARLGEPVSKEEQAQLLDIIRERLNGDCL